MALLDFGGITLRRHMFSGDSFLLGKAFRWGEQTGVPLAAAFAEFSKQGYSIGSLGIGPDSDIDRARLHLGLPAVAVTQNGTNQLTAPAVLSNKSPILSPIRGGKLTGGLTGVALFLESTDQYNTGYYKEGTAGFSLFSDSMNVVGAAASFHHPTLQVVLSGSAKSLAATWGRRNPLVWPTYNNGLWFNIMGNDAEGPYLVIPIHGRMRLAVTCRALGAGTFDVRLSVVSKQAESQIAPAAGFPTTTPIPLNGQVRFDQVLSGRAEWLIVYASRSAGAVAADSLLVEVRGDDS
jgi:hypothetical protein